MPPQEKIPVYDPSAFTEVFMPSEELKALLKGDIGKFLIVRVEDMYRHVHAPVPASRSTTNQCLFLTEGEAQMKIGYDLYTIRENELLFVPTGQVFSFKEDEQNKGYVCAFHNDLLMGFPFFEFLKVWGHPKIDLDPVTAGFVRPLFDRLLQDYGHHGLDHPDIIRAYLLAILCEVNTAYRPLQECLPKAGASLTHRFRELVFAHITHLHQVSDYASLLHVSPNHLSKTVKALTGKSPTRWIDEAIVLEAKVLLSQSPMTVSQVATAVGFEDQSYFTRLFKKYEGVTPSAFRKMIEKSQNIPRLS